MGEAEDGCGGGGGEGGGVVEVLALEVEVEALDGGVVEEGVVDCGVFGFVVKGKVEVGGVEEVAIGISFRFDGRRFGLDDWFFFDFRLDPFAVDCPHFLYSRLVPLYVSLFQPRSWMSFLPPSQPATILHRSWIP